MPIRGIHCLVELDRYFATGLIRPDSNLPTVPH
jgi:hypothetical protein